eukprot:4614521-Prymnesium_polylepis.1
MVQRGADELLDLALDGAGQPSTWANEHFQCCTAHALTVPSDLTGPVNRGNSLGAIVGKARRAVGTAQRARRRRERPDLIWQPAIRACATHVRRREL